MADVDDWQPISGSTASSGGGEDWQPVGNDANISEQQPGFLSNVKGDIYNRLAEQGASQEKWQQGQISAPELALHTVGKTLAGSLNDVIGQGIHSAVQSIPNQIKQPITNAMGNFIPAGVDQDSLDALKKVTQYYSDFSKNNPRTSDALESLANIASIAPAGKAFEGAGNVLKDVAFGTPESVLAKETASVTPKIISSTSKGVHDPVQAAQDLTNSIFGNITNANKYYELPKAIAGDAAVKAPQVGEYLQGVISDIKSNPMHEASSLVPKLQRTLDALPEDETIPVSDLLDLRKASNANFKPGRMTDKDGVYAGLNKAVNAGLDTARDEIPHFSDSLDVADNYWKNNVANPITKNTVLQKVFDMEDAHNVRQFMNGQITDIPDATMQAANKMIGKIRDVDTYNAVRRLLPAESGQALDAEVLKNVSPSRWNALVRTAKSAANFQPLNTVVNAADAIYPSATAEQKALIKAIKQQNTYTPMTARNAAANAQFGAVKEAMKPAPMLALPAPEARTINVPPGGFKSTYSPTDLNAPSEAGFQGGDKYFAQKIAPETAEASWLKNPYNYKKGGKVKTDLLKEHGLAHPQWVEFVKEHGKKHGYVLKDKANPEAVKMAASVIKSGV